MNYNYKPYFDFSGGYNDTTNQDLLKENELSICENIDLMPRGELSIRRGTEKINANSKGYDIDRRFEYLIRDTTLTLEVYNRGLYKVKPYNPDVLLMSCDVDAKFLQQFDVLYVSTLNQIYELGNRDYYSNSGTVTIEIGDIVQLTDTFSNENIAGKFYRAKIKIIDIDLNTATYTDTTKWEDVTDIRYATSNVIRPIKPYVAGKKEKITITVFNTVTAAGYISIYLDNKEYKINVTADQDARAVATAIGGTTFTGYTTSVSQNQVTVTANTIGYKENCYATSYNTGLSLVVNTLVNGEDDDNILNEVKSCTKFIYHTKSGRYVATGNGTKPYAVYFSEPMQLNYFKKFNVLTPTSSEGSPICLLNILDSVLVGYRHGWYEYSGLDPATDGTWRRLAIPYGCAAGESVQIIDFYNFIFLADNGLYMVSANILNQYGVVMQNNSALKNISDDKIENTIKSLVNKSSCRSVYYNGIYYLSHGNDDDYKIILYYTEKKAFTLYTDIKVNDFLYRKNGDLEIASKNYVLKFADNKFSDVDVTTGLDKRIEFEIKTINLALDNFIAEKFIDKIFVQANIDSNTTTEHLKLLLRIDYLTTETFEINLSDINSELALGYNWENYLANIQSALIRQKGNRIGITFTNKGLNDINVNIIIYGFAISYKSLTPYQKLSNNQFGNMG